MFDQPYGTVAIRFLLGNKYRRHVPLHSEYCQVDWVRKLDQRPLYESLATLWILTLSLSHLFGRQECRTWFSCPLNVVRILSRKDAVDERTSGAGVQPAPAPPPPLNVHDTTSTG